MVATLVSIALALAGFYVVFVLTFFTGMKRLRSSRSPKRHSVSVVVAARNEERNLRACLDALVAQDYAGTGAYEIVIVNDRSTDRTDAILGEYERANPGVRIVDVESCPEGFAPKKFALSRGIECARGEIICTTDADCVPSPGWVSQMVSRFDDEVGFVAGPAPQYLRDHASVWLADFVYLESLAGAALSAGGIGWNLPWTCSGANLAYRKQAFEEVGGFEAVKGSVSGDDDLLMFLFSETTRWRLDYALHPDAVVRGYEDAGLGGLVHQRARRMSKAPLYPFRLQCIVLLLVLFYTAFAVLPLYVVATGEFASAWLGIVASRFGVEFLAVSRGARLIGAELGLASFTRGFVLHPVAIVTCGLFGTLGRFSWQPRRVI